MKIEDFRLLKKLLNMTLSGADQERLFSIDRANEIVRRSNTTWDKILDRVIKVEVEIEGRDEPKAPADVARARAEFAKGIDAAFATIEESDPRGEAADFISSLKSQWAESGRLTGPQIAALRKFESNARRRTEGRG